MFKVIPNVQIFLILLLLSLIIFGLDSIGFLNLLKQGAFYITNPISFGLYRSSQVIGKQFYFISALRLSAQENKALKEQLAELFAENAQLRKKLSETESLLSQQQSINPRTYNLISSRPIGLGRFLKIDKGSSEGVKVGQAVIFQDNYIGRIFQVSQNSANIQILFDPDSKIAAFSQSLEGRARGVLLGQFGLELLLDKILHEERISVGDLIFTEGTEGFLPRGLILGKITQVMERENEVFKQAKVQPIFDLRDLELVFVIQE